MKTRTKIILFGVVVAAAGLAYAAQQPQVQTQLQAVKGSWFGRKQADRQSPRDRAIPVVAAPANLADVPVYVMGVGSVKPVNSVAVRAQVSGRVIKIRFQEGQDLKTGDVIAQLDDALYKAQLDQAIGKKAQDQAQLANAQLELERFQRLVNSSATTQQQLDNQKALVAQYTAQVQSDQAAIEAAQAQLDYTTIRAPIDGRTGIRNVDVGNIVSGGDSNGIVTLSQIRPITVVFSVPQQDLVRVNAANAKGPLTVDAFADDGKTVLASGKLTVVDNQVDATTGTVKLRAEFSNETLALWPGAFVNARLLVDTRRHVLTVPSAAVQRGPGGTYSYIVSEDNTVKMQAITVAAQDDQLAVISDGIHDGDRVVTTGFARLQDGAQVRVSTPEEADPSKMAVPLPDESQSRSQRRKGGNNRNNGQNGAPAGDHAAPPQPGAQSGAPAQPGTEQQPSGHRRQNGGAQSSSTGPDAPKSDAQKAADASK